MSLDKFLSIFPTLGLFCGPGFILWSLLSCYGRNFRGEHGAKKGGFKGLFMRACGYVWDSVHTYVSVYMCYLYVNTDIAHIYACM